MSGKTELQRDILLTWYENPGATNAEIADACDCSASYVSQIKNRFDDYNHMEAMMDRQDKEMEQMFGDDIFASHSGSSSPVSGSTAEPEPVSLLDAYENAPDNLAGYLVQAFVVLILVYVLYETATILLL